jgi:acylpyruvate hydrolase
MRLATIADGGGTAAAVLSDGRAALVDGGRFADVGELLRSGEDLTTLDVGEAREFHAAELRRPVLTPGAIVCVGLNYRTHILEMGRDLPEQPTLFGKLARALTDPCADITLPAVSHQVDYEGELAVVIGRGGRDIAPGAAWEAVAGLTLMNDVSMRDYQWRTTQWFAGKTFESSTPMGPVLVTPDELDRLGERELRVRVNGELRQHAPLGDLVFDVPTLVADVSRIVTLEPGDVIATGTPGGVGAAMEPKAFLRPGDVVEVEVDGIGALGNRFVEA